jgi:hypothetical protein
MGKGGAGKQHIQATQQHVDQLLEAFTELRAQRGSNEAELLDKYWWLISDTTLRRFITANNCDVDAAQAQILSHLEWRGPYGVDTITEEDFSDMAALNELYWRGFNNKGYPILVWNAARHNASGVIPAERYTRYFVYLLETGARDFFGGSEKPGLFSIMLNAKGVGRRNIDFAMMKLAGPIIEVSGEMCSRWVGGWGNSE